MARILSDVLGREARSQQIALAAFEQRFLGRGASEAQALERMLRDA